MDKNTKGILLHRIEHSDTSAILKVLTPEEGLSSFIWKGAKKAKKGGSYGSIATPLNRLEITARFKEEEGLHLLKEARIEKPSQNLISDPERSAIALFLGEFLYRSSRSQPPDPAYYDEVETCIEMLDRTQDPKDLHLHFIARSMHAHGIAPDEVPDGNEHFDLLEAQLKSEEPSHGHSLTPRESELLDRMLRTPLQEHQRFLKGTGSRQELLRKLIEHYRIHLGDFGPIHSLEVLQELFAT